MFLFLLDPGNLQAVCLFRNAKNVISQRSPFQEEDQGFVGKKAGEGKSVFVILAEFVDSKVLSAVVVSLNLLGTGS